MADSGQKATDNQVSNSQTTSQKPSASVPPPPPKPQYVASATGQAQRNVPNPKNLVVNTSSSEGGSRFSRFFSKIKYKWQNTPKKVKIPVAIFFGLITFIFGYALFFGNWESLRDFAKREFNLSFEEFGDWKRLEIPQREKPFFTLKSTTESKYGILPKEVLILKSEKPVSTEFINSVIESLVPVTVVSSSVREFKITPDENLGLDELLAVKLNVEGESYDGHEFDRDYSWAYQTQGKFRVVSNIPGDKKTEVPVNTGIEIVFSQDDIENPVSYISISPSIKFRAEIHAETLAIVPIDPLEEKTVYTVTLKKGLNLKSRNDPIDEDFTFSFQTKEKEEKPLRLGLAEDYQQISPDEVLITKVNTANLKPDSVIKTEVYRFSSPEAFINSRDGIDKIKSSWMRYYAEEEEVDTSGLDKVLTADLEVQKNENLQYLQFPDTLPNGFYLVKFWSEEEHKLEQLWLQSTPVTGYVSVGKEQTVVWANHFDSGPAKSAGIRVAGATEEYQTYDNGVSVFNTPQILFNNDTHYVVVTDEDQNKVALLVDSLKRNSPPGETTQDDYWSYLYNERYLYKPTDTVYFFGVAKNRSSNQVPATVEVSLLASGYGEYGEKISKTITPSSDGSFIGSFELDNIPRGWYTMALYVNGVRLSSSGFSVTEYEKPEMKIEVTADKKAIFTDEEVKFSARVTFYDGTPVSDVPVKIHGRYLGDTVEINTNENGEIEYIYKPTYEESSGGYNNYPRYESVVFTPALAQETKVEGHGSVYVYGSKLRMETTSEQDESKATLKVAVNNIVLDEVNSGESNETNGPPAANQKVELRVTKTWYEKKEIGTYYDFVEKVTRKTYNYVDHTDVIDEKTLHTDSRGEVSYEFTLEEKKSYEVELVIKDSDGHSDSVSEYFYYRSGSNQGLNSLRQYPQLNVDKEENTYSVGEEIKLNIMLGEEEYPDNDKNKFLFIIADQGKQEVALNDDPKFNFNFEDRYIPNIYVSAMVFTGKYYIPVSAPCRRNWYCGYYYQDNHYFNGFEILYKKDDSKLDLSINTSLSDYEPGGEATVSVKVEKDGNPVSGASVNLVLVDEALAAIDGVREPSILSTLYKSVSSNIYYSYSTHEPVFPNESAAEYGGGGGGDRDLFKDAALFDRSITDENGVATFSFTLPDNITSWIMYAQAITGDIDAGQNQGSLVVTKDFFVTSQFPKQYLVDDEPFVTAGSFGKGLDKNAKVGLEAVYFEDDREIYKQEQTASAYRSSIFAFPDLSSGEYSLSVRGSVNDMKDGINLPFEVINTRLDFEHYKKFTLEKGEELNSAGVNSVLEDKPVKLIVSNKGEGCYYCALLMYCSTRSNRLEKLLAKKVASSVLIEKFDDNICKIKEDEFSNFQYTDGGLSQVSWGGSNLETTAWAVSVDPEPFDKELLVSYFEGKLKRQQAGTVQRVYSAWGLTELGEPQVNELRFVSNNASTFEEKIIAGIALASAGETELAREIYYDILADYAYEYKPYVRLQPEDMGENENDRYIESTSLALLLGSMVEKTYDEGLYNYIRDFKDNSEDIIIDLSTISFIEEELSKLPEEDTKIYFKSALNELEKELKNGRSVVLPLKSSEINNFTLKVLAGKAEAYVSYFVGPEGFSQLDTDDKLEIRRTYKKVKGGGGDIKTGDIIEVRIDFDVDHELSPPGAYRITDHLPSGFKYLPNSELYGLESEGWTTQVDNNIIRSTFYNSPWWQKNGKKYVKYYVRASSVGEYVAEPAIIQSLKELSLFQKTAEEVINIKGSNL